MTSIILSFTPIHLCVREREREGEREEREERERRERREVMIIMIIKIVIKIIIIMKEKLRIVNK